jgi:hypothetical protein
VWRYPGLHLGLFKGGDSRTTGLEFKGFPGTLGLWWPGLPVVYLGLISFRLSILHMVRALELVCACRPFYGKTTSINIPSTSLPFRASCIAWEIQPYYLFYKNPSWELVLSIAITCTRIVA